MSNSEKLGKIVSSHPVGKLGWAYVSLGLLIVLAGLFFGVWSWLNVGEEWAVGLLLLAIVLLGMGMMLLWRWYQYRNAAIEIYLNGFRYIYKGRSRDVFWDQIKWVKQLNNSFIGRMPRFPRRIDLRIKLYDGAQYYISQQIFQNMKELSHNFQQCMAKARLPAVLGEIDQGKKIDFGAYKVDAQGISTWFKHLKWEQLESVQIVRGILYVSQKNKTFDWSRAHLIRVDNHYIFMAVAAEMLRRRPSQNIV